MTGVLGTFFSDERLPLDHGSRVEGMRSNQRLSEASKSEWWEITIASHTGALLA